MTQVPLPGSPLLLGFGGLERALDRIARKQPDGYPPYNIERFFPADGAVEKLRITLAVAGFALGELDISLQANQLIISGKQNDDKTRTYLHRGIATRQFQRVFVLAEGVHVVSAESENGLLIIDLERPAIEPSLRKIGIVQKD
ncbi:MAG: Hsp20 family protein [Chitinophagales bacterium]|nr:Hsp20 family protein [Hyphomicrobiales bacterium]